MDFQFPPTGKVSEHAFEFLTVQAFDFLRVSIFDLERHVLSEKTDEGALAGHPAPLPEFFDGVQALGDHSLFQLCKGLRIDGRKNGSFDEALDPGPGKPVGAE